jgi:DNA ligase-1
MRAFTRLFRAIDATTKTSAKLAALEEYFTSADPADAAWAVYFLSGGRLRRLVTTTQLRVWAAEAASLPLWLLEESYDAVGDLAETVALLLPDTATEERNWSLHRLVADRLEPLAEAEEAERRRLLERTWCELPSDQRFVWNKLITGAFRVGVSRGLVTRALGRVAGLEPAQIAHRLAGRWQPSADTYRRLIDPQAHHDEPGRPYPFYLASPLEADPESLGPVSQWQAEWKWDGIRAQIIRRRHQTLIWTRGEELVTDRFPEVRDAAEALPDGTVLDGEILAWKDDGPLPFGDLQRRIGRKTVGRKLLTEVPLAFMAYDQMEHCGRDIRAMPLSERRSFLEATVDAVASPPLLASPVVTADDWNALAEIRKQSRRRRVEGLMLKAVDSPYRAGRPRGDWWKWKVEPFTMDAVLLYAQRGHGRRASLYTDFTFAVWSEDGDLVPVAKAYSGLTDAEIREVDRWIRRHITDRFGPVRQVKPELVFEVAFEGVRTSTRHKAGLAVRFPRIRRRRPDKRPEDADRLGDLEDLVDRA